MRIYFGEGEKLDQARGNDRLVVRKTLKYIQHHYRERITMKKLARNSFLGESRFYQIFKKHMGTSPNEYLCRYRMEKARILLSSSYMSVSQIAEYLGYNSIHYFSRSYRRYYDSTPSSIRAKNRSQN
jgi:AraC-like DNA-binding protein